MYADERGLENPKPIVWMPTPDMYRTDTPEGREAYEACLRRTMAPRPGAERRPPQPVSPTPARGKSGAVRGPRSSHQKIALILRRVLNSRRSGMTWNAVGYQGRGEENPGIG